MTKKKPDLYLGCISGTSVDGLDIAVISISDDNNIEVLQATTALLPERLRTQLLALGVPGEDDLDTLGQCDMELGMFTGQAILSFLASHDLSPDEIIAIGSHGQTVRHRPPGDASARGFTHQIGDPNQIAEITGIQTVADFRRRDMAAGGHGAPLVPPFHQALFQPSADNMVVLNIGGISNVSILGDDLCGFDTGPGNALMDNWCEQHQGLRFDSNGDWGATGKVNEKLLEDCLRDPYFALPPPKSSGREYFNMAWLQPHLTGTNIHAVDVQTTLCELTARCTTDALQLWATNNTELIVCGGGRLNAALMQRLQNNTSARVTSSEHWQIDGDSLEAALFAWLAHRTLNGQAGNEPAVTGAAGYRVLGAIYPA